MTLREPSARPTLLGERFKEAVAKAKPKPIQTFDGDVIRYTLNRIIEMTVVEWHTIPDNPRQRDTEQRARTTTHLRILEDAHVIVRYAVTPDGKKYKLDGHTRDFMWANGLTDHVPSKLYVEEYLAANMATVIKLYERFDNKKAVETSQDVMSGAHKLVDLQLTSTLLKSGRYVTAVKQAFAFCHNRMGGYNSTVDPLIAVRYFHFELRLLDGIDPKSSLFSTAEIEAALLTLMWKGERALGFWKLYNDSDGQKTRGKWDAVEALTNAHKFAQIHKQLAGASNVRPMLGRALNAFQHWEDEEWFQADRPRPLNDAKIKSIVEAAVKARSQRTGRLIPSNGGGAKNGS